MRLVMLASGSEGNAALIETDKTCLLVDNGLSCRELVKRMAEVGRSPGDLDGLILSHEHGDHVSGVVTLLNYTAKRGRMLTVYATELCAGRLDWGRIDRPPVTCFAAGRPFEIGDIAVDPFTVLHDCVDPVNFVFSQNGERIGFSTDLGTVPPAMKRLFRDCQTVVVESNHDVDMLKNGPHPLEVKTRVAGPMGHLSNTQASEFVAGDCGASTVVLGHLSTDNNTVRIAEWEARRALLCAGRSAEVLVASQHFVLDVMAQGAGCAPPPRQEREIDERTD